MAWYEAFDGFILSEISSAVEHLLKTDSSWSSVPLAVGNLFPRCVSSLVRPLALIFGGNLETRNVFV